MSELKPGTNRRVRSILQFSRTHSPFRNLTIRTTKMITTRTIVMPAQTALRSNSMDQAKSMSEIEVITAWMSLSGAFALATGSCMQTGTNAQFQGSTFWSIFLPPFSCLTDFWAERWGQKNLCLTLIEPKRRAGEGYLWPFLQSRGRYVLGNFGMLAARSPELLRVARPGVSTLTDIDGRSTYTKFQHHRPY